MYPQLVGVPEKRDLLRQPLLDPGALPGRQPAGVQIVQKVRDRPVLAADAPPLRLGRVGCEHQVEVHPVQSVPEVLRPDALLGEPGEAAPQRSPLRLVLRGLVLPAAADPVVAFGDVDQLEVDRERPHDAAHLRLVHAVDPVAEPLVEFGVVVKAQPLAEKPDLLFRPKKALAFLLPDHLPQGPAQQVDVPAQGLVFGGESYAGWQVRILLASVSLGQLRG